jgi:nucleoside-diphosphate kinase
MIQEETVMIIKPESLGVALEIITDLMKSISTDKLVIKNMQVKTLTSEQAEQLYAQHADRDFFPSVVKHMSSNPVVALLIAGGENTVAKVRKQLGATNPEVAEPGTLRHKYGKNVERNGTHASDSAESAAREKNIIFG